MVDVNMNGQVGVADADAVTGALCGTQNRAAATVPTTTKCIFVP